MAACTIDNIPKKLNTRCFKFVRACILNFSIIVVGLVQLFRLVTSKYMTFLLCMSSLKVVSNASMSRFIVMVYA